MAEPLNVGMLIPPEVSASAAMRAAIEEIADHELAADLSKDGDPPYDESVAEIVAELKQMIFEVADEQRVRFAFQEYQVYSRKGQGEALGKKRRVHFLENDLLVAIDPTPLQCALISSVMHPRQRLAAAFTRRDALFEEGRMLSTSKIPIFDRKTASIRQALQRAFLFHVPPNEADRAMAYHSSKQVLAGAFAYPNTPPQDIEEGRFTRIWNPDEDGSAKP